ncbi:hypothetical protein GCM10010121_078530 [Streptomyces brasiliensis]|uniref:Uncharacterized protein n=1 Tax=Streptomyces brasiliensis TaxID=1954 RepID=A0A917P2H6_9ACTN|nr:hypothetical protein GCM10010121_078530 [Streptomyces brasiliensis]
MPGRRRPGAVTGSTLVRWHEGHLQAVAGGFEDGSVLLAGPDEEPWVLSASGAAFGAGEGNPWAYAGSRELSDLLPALSAGNVYFGNPALFAGTLGLLVDGAAPMGSVTVSNALTRNCGYWPTVFRPAACSGWCRAPSTAPARPFRSPERPSASSRPPTSPRATWT